MTSAEEFRWKLIEASLCCMPQHIRQLTTGLVSPREVDQKFWGITPEIAIFLGTLSVTVLGAAFGWLAIRR